MAASLSNLGYTGGAFVCYALFGTAGLALANIYLLPWLPITYLIFFPILKAYELRTAGENKKFKLKQLFDFRLIALPTAICALFINAADIKSPSLINNYYIVDSLVYTASAMSFFAIGLRVKLSMLKNYINLFFYLSAIKFILTPILALSIIWLLSLTGQNLDPLVRNVIIVLSLAPSAVLMVTISNVFDLDSRLASALWIVTTAVFIIIIIPVLFTVFS